MKRTHDVIKVNKLWTSLKLSRTICYRHMNGCNSLNRTKHNYLEQSPRKERFDRNVFRSFKTRLIRTHGPEWPSVLCRPCAVATLTQWLRPISTVGPRSHQRKRIVLFVTSTQDGGVIRKAGDVTKCDQSSCSSEQQAKDEGKGKEGICLLEEIPADLTRPTTSK